MNKKPEEKTEKPLSNHDQMADLLKQIKIADTHHASERARLLAEYEAETKPKK